MDTEHKYLAVLSELYPNIAITSRAIINYQSILNLPKGTENYLSDIHGEFAAFSHVLRNGSGAVRKILEEFGCNLPDSHIINGHVPVHQIEGEVDVISHVRTVYQTSGRRLMRDTDEGQVIIEKIRDLKELLQAYRSGRIRERK